MHSLRVKRLSSLFKITKQVNDRSRFQIKICWFVNYYFLIFLMNLLRTEKYDLKFIYISIKLSSSKVKLPKLTNTSALSIFKELFLQHPGLLLYFSLINSILFGCERFYYKTISKDILMYHLELKRTEGKKWGKVKKQPNRCYVEKKIAWGGI